MNRHPGPPEEKRQSMEKAGSYHHSMPFVLGKKINPSQDPQFTPVHLQFCNKKKCLEFWQLQYAQSQQT